MRGRPVKSCPCRDFLHAEGSPLVGQDIKQCEGPINRLDPGATVGRGSTRWPAILSGTRRSSSGRCRLSTDLTP